MINSHSDIVLVFGKLHQHPSVILLQQLIITNPATI